MTERILNHYRIQLTRDNSRKDGFTHIALTSDDKTVFTADAYSADMLNDTLRMLCDWLTNEAKP